MSASDLPLREAEPDAARLRALLRAVRNSNVCVLYQRPDLTYAWGENLPVYWQNNWKAGGTDEDFIVSTSLAKLKSAKETALQTMTAQNVELSIMDGNKLHWVELHIDCDRDTSGNLLGLVTTALEISELKRREQVLKTLLREVSHRSKNMLAIVQSIASQTARFTDTIDDFLLKFRGRIQSLSYSQDLVTDSNWRGALFRDLVHSQVEKYIDVTDERLSLEGDNPYLFPGAALHVGLALHELVVNATSFGGLSIPYGRVAISAEVVRTENEGEKLVFRWEETNPAMPEVYQHDPRFGSAVLQRIVPASVNGQAQYRIDGTGAVYSLTIPDEQFDS
ncbi:MULTISPECIES: sensor histidine kinase [Brucella/Ochrobactrum group]|uniref:histidine kinase n=2 Tax=Ochrobactrum TaxID=528 RepID=A0A2P9HQ67_9HYPH|nr:MULTISPECIES: sensor histidine kinase [Brucella]MCI1000010.1 sensor histidine kinase [Ochrobactrum sp. C6C9]RRD24186.1 sensor histidine kinase [Brucellaceae bacterium VT-16-1752]MDX4074339.1 sensor histidine kinase [Brucella sp. NBRC 113783]NNU62205.1 sensor histidine kinase [[Ochrobactrum] soli]RLL73446.1 sensor histidine kinase [[Ochrobactrum] soli]